jgi:hypothetical protein
VNVNQKAAIDALFEKHGKRINATHVISAARNSRSPLHSAFTWDKVKGWQKNLESEARILLCQYWEITMIDDKPVRSRAIVSLRSERKHGGGYRRVSDVLSTAALRAQMLEDALAELAYYESKYRTLTELAAVFEAAAKVRASARKKKAA